MIQTDEAFEKEIFTAELNSWEGDNAVEYDPVTEETKKLRRKKGRRLPKKSSATL